MPIKITDAFKAVKGTGIFLDEKDFSDQLKNNPKDTYDAISSAKQTKGLFLDYPDFETTLGLKKKDVVAEVGEQESPNGLVATPPSLSPLQSAQKNNTEQAPVDIFAVRGNVKTLTGKLAAEDKLNQSASSAPGYIPVAANTSTTAKELEVATQGQENKYKQLSSKFGVSVDEIKKVIDQLNTPIGEDKLDDLLKSTPDERSRQIAAYNWLLQTQAFYKNTDPANYRKFQNQLLAIQGYQTDPTTGEVKLDENGNKIKSNPDYKANRSLTSAGRNLITGMNLQKSDSDIVHSNFAGDKKVNYNFGIKGAREAVQADPRNIKSGGYLDDNQVLALQYYEDTNPDLAANYEKLNTSYAKTKAPTMAMPEGWNKSQNEKGEAYVRMERDLATTGAMLNLESTTREISPLAEKANLQAPTTEEKKIFDDSLATIDTLKGSIGDMVDLFKKQEYTPDENLTVNAYSSQLERAKETIDAIKNPTTPEDFTAYNNAATDYNHAAFKIKEILDTKPTISAATKADFTSKLNSYNTAVSNLNGVQDAIKKRSLTPSETANLNAIGDLHKKNVDAYGSIFTDPRFALANQADDRAIAKELSNNGDGVIMASLRVLNEKAAHLRDFANGIGTKLISTTKSDQYNNATQIGVIQGLNDETFNKIQNNKNLTIQHSEYVFANASFKKELDVINNSKLSGNERQEKVLDLIHLYNNAGGTGFSKISIDPKFNFSAKSILMSIGTTATDLGAFMATLAFTGGMSAEASVVSKMAAMGSTVFMDGIAPEYARLLASGNRNPTANALLNTSINAAAMILAEPGKILDVSPSLIKRLFSKETAIGKMVNELTDKELSSRLSQTGYSKLAEFLKTNGINSISGATKLTLATTLGQMSIQKLAGEKIDYDATMKEGGVSLLSQIPVFFAMGAMHATATPFHKSALYEAASHPEFYNSEVIKMVKEGKLTQEKADEITKNTLFASQVLSKIENIDSEGKVLNDTKKADLLFQKTKEAGLLEYLKKDIPDAVREKVETEIKAIKYNVNKIQAPELSIIESKAKESDFEISNDPTGFADGVKAQQETLGADGIQVTPYEQAEYDNEAKNGAKFWRSKDGSSFGILKASGEMASVVKGAGSKLKGVAGAMLESMKKQGGKFLDNFDTHLTGIYKKAGFEVAARLPFNEEFAPAGWDAEGSPLKNKPDIVMMVRRDLMPSTGEVKFTDYDQAQKYIKEIVAVKKISTPKQAKESFTPEESKLWKQHMVEGNQEAADALVHSKMDIEKKVYTVENIDSVDTEGYSGVQKEVISDVKGVFKAVSKLVNESTGKPLSIHIHANDKSFAEAEGVGEQNSGSKGMYMSSDGSIHLNMARVTPETMLHEAFHPVLDIIEKNNPELIDKLHAQLATIKGGDKIIENNNRKYNGDVTRKKEAITDFIAQVADGTFKLNQSNFEQAKNYIINALRKIGLGSVLDKFGAIKNAEDLRSLAKMISEKFNNGEEISTKDLGSYINKAETVTSAEGIDNNFTLGSIKGESNRGIQFSKLDDETVKSVKVSIIDYKSIPSLKIARTLFYDNTRVGDLEVKNRLTGYTPKVVGNGGFFYSYMPEALKEKAVLAFTSVNQAIQTLKRQMLYPDAAQAIAAQNFQTAHLGNKSTLRVLFGEKGSKKLGIFQEAVNDNEAAETELLEALKVSTISISEQKVKSGKNAGNPTGASLEISKMIERNGGNLDNIKSINDFRDKVLTFEGGDSFGGRNVLFSEMFQDKPTKVSKSTREAHKILHYKYGIPTLAEIAEGNNQKQLNNAETGDVIKLVKPYADPVIYTTSEELFRQFTDTPTTEMIDNGITIKLLPKSLHHESYPFVLRGENVGLLDNYIAAPQMYQEHDTIKNVEKKKSFYSVGRMKSDSPAGTFPKEVVSEGAPQFSRAERLKREDGINKAFDDGLIDKAEYEEMMDAVKLATATSTKNSTVAAEREARGLDMINKSNPETFEDWKTKGIDAIDKTFFPDLEAISIIKSPRALSAVENASMLYHRTKLDNQREELIDLINELGGDKRNIEINTIKLLEVEELINRNDEAVTRSGTEAGRALTARKMMMSDDYTLVNMERRLKAISGGKTLDKDLMDKLRGYEAQIKDLQERLDKYEKGGNTEAIKTELKKAKASVTIKKLPDSAVRAKVSSAVERMRAFISNKQFSRSERIELEKEQVSILKDLFKIYVEQGLTDHVEIIDNIHSDLADVLDISKDQLRDEISGYGKTSELSKEDIDVAMRDIKAQMKLFSSMEDVENNERPLKSGLQREDPSDTVRQMRQQLNDMMKKADFKDEKSEKEYKSALDAIKKRLINQIIDLENMIKTGERRQPSERVEYDMKANYLLTLRDNLKDTLNQIDEASGLTAERKSKAVENTLKRSIENLERRINNNELEPKKADKAPDSETVERLRARKDALQAELNQLRKDAGIIDANKLEAYKKSLKKRAEEYQRRIDNNEFEKKTPEERKIDKETLGLLSAIEDVKMKFDVAKLEFERKNMSAAQRYTKKALKFRRAILLSSITTLGKIGAAGSGLMVTKPLEQIAGSGIRLLPGFKTIAADAPREGAGFNFKIEAKAVTELFRNRIKLSSGEEVNTMFNDMGRIMKGKKGNLESVYGKKVPHIEESEFFGNTHAVIKYMPKMSEVYRSMEIRFEYALRKGEDIADPVVYARIVSEAIIDGNRNIFMGKNLVTDAYKSVKRTLEAKGMMGKAGANVMDFLFPIVSVPTNFVLATAENLVGVAAAPAMIAMKGGVKKLTPAEKDTVMRLMKKGSVGLAFLALGILNPQSIGGYYSGKRKEGDLEENTMELFGVKIGKWAMHTPLLEVMQFGATVRRIIDKQNEDGEITSYSSAVGTASAKLTEEIPFVNTTSDLLDAMDDGNKGKKFLANTTSSLVVPPDVRKLTKGEGAFAPVAKALGYNGDVDSDGEVYKRRAISFVEQIEANMPGLRETLPLDVKAEQKKAKGQIESKLNKGEDPSQIDEALIEKAGIDDIDDFNETVQLDSKTREFKTASAEKQMKLWTTFGDTKKGDVTEYLHEIEVFDKLFREKPELLREPKYNRAYNNIKSILE